MSGPSKEFDPGAASTLPMNFTPLEKSSLGQQAYRKIRHALMVGDLRPGQTITFRAMAAQFNTSVTPIREALLQLVGENVLSATSRSIMVPSFDFARIAELEKVRILVECFAAAEATPIIPAETIDELESIHDTLMALTDIRDRASRNQQFHFTLYKAAKLEFTWSIIESIWVNAGPLNYHIIANSRTYFSYRRSQSERDESHPHVEILRGLRARDPAMVRAGIERDIRAAMEIARHYHPWE